MNFYNASQLTNDDEKNQQSADIYNVKLEVQQYRELILIASGKSQ